MSDRKEITKLLSDLLIRDVLGNTYWANEVTFNYGRAEQHRVDFMTFKPMNQTASGIEKGVFAAFEVKSCLADYRNKNGHNFNMEKNYYVMPMELYKQVVNELPHYIGVYCPVPYEKEKIEEFESPTASKDLQYESVKLQCIKNAYPKDRNISSLETLFCMFRSGYMQN